MDIALAGLVDEDGEESHEETIAPDCRSPKAEDGKGEKRSAEAPGATSEEPEQKKAKAEDSSFTKVDDEAEVKDEVEDEKKDEVKDELKHEAESNTTSEGWFKVVAPLNLQLNLKIGGVYSAANLRRKCGSNRSKLQKLEKFMKQRSKLVPVDAPQASNAPSQADEDAPQTPPRTTSKVASEMSSSPPQPYVFGQVVWHRRPDGVSVLAKVVQIDDGPDIIKYRLEPLTEDSGCTEERFETSHSTLAPFEVMDMKKLIPPQDAVVASLPSHRETQPFRIGQVVWWFGPKRPSWPAKIFELPASEKDNCKIQLFDPNLVRSSSTGPGEILAEPISVHTSELLRMEKNDLLAFSQVMQVVKDACVEQDAASATTA